MADLLGKLVVRSHAPKRRAVRLASSVLLALVVIYGAFELGRYDAGFRVVDSVRGALSASTRIRRLEAENNRQREQLEAAEVTRRVWSNPSRWCTSRFSKCKSYPKPRQVSFG